MNNELLINDAGIIAKAELDTQIATARSYPRPSLSEIMAYAIQLATIDETTAQSCFYCIARKDKDGIKKEIRGPSIRLAEIIMCAWGNIHAATRIVENDGHHITAEGVAWDLQTNVKTAMQHKVSIRFGEKNGSVGYTANSDMQTVLSNAAAAKALRNAIFKVIPKVLVDKVFEKAMSFSVGDQKTISSRVIEVIEKLNKMGIDKEKILNYYGYENISQITPEDFKSLIGVGTAIKEGHMRIEEAFDVEKDGNNGSSIAREKLNQLFQEKQFNKKTGELIEKK